MRTVFLVPRRDDGGPRDRLWAYARARWERYFPDIEIVEGHHVDGPFNRSAAINRAAAKAGAWDLGIVIDSDVILSVSQVRAAIDRAAETGRVTWAHRRWRGIAEMWVERILADRQDFGPELDRDQMDLLVERTNPLSWSCCFVVPRTVWDDAGGFDERFRGWGFEDMAWQSLVCGLYGHERIEGDVIHLWHPRSEERIVPGRDRTTATPEYVTNARLGRRYMVALRRDHALHDRGEGPTTEVERERDIANLIRDDAKFRGVAMRLGLPDWDAWWPSLEELRDGAKAARGIPAASIALIVRTGGEPDRWEERMGYLRRSLASLERVSGPISQRVVYSDWGDERKAELAAIVGPYGFYVAGPPQHTGFPGCMTALWGYIDRRVQTEYVFLTEDDFVYERDVDLVPLVETLQSDPFLAQVALLRDAYYQSERDKGGILGWPVESFTAVAQGNGHGRLEHRNFFTLNPSLIRRSLVQTAWPARPSSERVFGDLLVRDARTRFAFWGNGEPWVSHIGETRAASVY